MTFQAANLEQQLIRRDAQIDRMRVELEVLKEVEAAALISAELAPRVPDGNKLGHTWTIPNPVIVPLAKLDKIRSRNRGALERMQGKVPK